MANAPTLEIDGLEIHAPITDAYAEILTPDALRFVATLDREFRDRRTEPDGVGRPNFAVAEHGIHQARIARVNAGATEGLVRS